jgi:L-threonine kinase
MMTSIHSNEAYSLDILESLKLGNSFFSSNDDENCIPGTCGELVQGLYRGQEFLINSPIPYYAKASVKVFQGRDVHVLGQGQWTKVKKSVESVIAQVSGDQNIGAIVSIDSEIPRGKGFASSTAEMTAAIAAILNTLSLKFSDQFFTDILLSIDKSTDAVYLPGITAIHHLTGKKILSLGNPPPLAFIAVDDGGEVETCAFDRKKARSVASKHVDFYEWAVRCMMNAFRSQSTKTIGRIATESARINQKILFKNLFEDLLKGTEEFGAIGVNCAHTGSALGVMYDPRFCNLERLLTQVEKIAGTERILGFFPLIGGKNLT